MTVGLGSGPPDVDRLGVCPLGSLPAGPSGDGYVGRNDGSLVCCTSHFQPSSKRPQSTAHFDESRTRGRTGRRRRQSDAVIADRQSDPRSDLAETNVDPRRRRMVLGVAEGDLSHSKQRQIRLGKPDPTYFHRLGERGNAGTRAKFVCELTKCCSEADVVEKWRTELVSESAELLADARRDESHLMNSLGGCAGHTGGIVQALEYSGHVSQSLNGIVIELIGEFPSFTFDFAEKSIRPAVQIPVGFRGQHSRKGEFGTLRVHVAPDSMETIPW